MRRCSSVSILGTRSSRLSDWAVVGRPTPDKLGKSGITTPFPHIPLFVSSHYCFMLTHNSTSLIKLLDFRILNRPPSYPRASLFPSLPPPRFRYIFWHHLHDL